MAQFDEAHLAKVRENGTRGGRTPGPHPEQKHCRPIYPPSPEFTEAIIDHTALVVMQGKSPFNATPLVNPISERDRQQLARFTNISADEFTTRLVDRLRALADLTTDRIQQKLSEDKFKPHELSFLLTVVVDKLKNAEQRGAMAGANVNIQVNNFGPDTREAIIARLSGEALTVPAPALAVAEAPAPSDATPADTPLPRPIPAESPPVPASAPVAAPAQAPA